MSTYLLGSANTCATSLVDTFLPLISYCSKPPKDPRPNQSSPFRTDKTPNLPCWVESTSKVLLKLFVNLF